MILENFPRYTDYSPMVPVWCVTPNRSGCIHRFFDTSPISPSGRYLAVFQLPFENRQPQPGEKGNVIIIDLKTGNDVFIAETHGWEPQMGANINWGGTDEELFFNDVDTTKWQPFSWKLNPLSGARERLDGTVFHASNDGRWIVSANLTTMRKTQSGYGVQVPDKFVRRNVGPADDDGFYITDASSGESRLFASIRFLLEQAMPPVQIDDPKNQEIYGFHSKFNPQGDTLMLSLRWYSKDRGSLAQKFKTKIKRIYKNTPRVNPVQFAWVTMGVEGGPIHCAAGPELWRKGGHHANWFPNGKQISMNLNIDGDGMKLVQVNADGTGLRKMVEDVVGTGHPTVHLNGRHLVTDSYLSEYPSYGDGTVPLRLVDLESGKEEVIVRINTKQPTEDRVMRVDPHPAWDRTWRYVVFNGFLGGTRRVFIADMSDAIN